MVTSVAVISASTTAPSSIVIDDSDSI